MKNKGFTLIELLAVIVILAIIALIAVPIIINIINDSREESYKRSIELYGKAVEETIAHTQLTEEVPAGDLNNITLSNNKKILDTVQYSGSKVECTTNILYGDGKIYLAGCTVGGYSVDYTYGKPQYAYLWYDGSNVNGPSIGGDASSLSPSAPTDNNYYLKYKLNDNNEVTNSYACAKFAGEEYCVEGGGYDDTTDSSSYYGWDTDAAHSTGNVKKIYDIQQASISGVSCYFESDTSNCNAGSVNLNAYSDGNVRAYDGGYSCDVTDGGSSYCGNL